MNKEREQDERRPSIIVFHGFASIGTDSLDEAFEFIANHTEHTSHIEMKMELPGLSAWVKGNNTPCESVIISTPFMSGEVLRSVSTGEYGFCTPGLGVSISSRSNEDPVPCRSLNIPINISYDPERGAVQEYNDPDVDLAMAWVILDNKDNVPTLKYVLKPKRYDKEKIAEINSRVNGKVMSVISDALQSKNPMLVE